MNKVFIKFSTKQNGSVIRADKLQFYDRENKNTIKYTAKDDYYPVAITNIDGEVGISWEMDQDKMIENKYSKGFLEDLEKRIKKQWLLSMNVDSK